MKLKYSNQLEHKNESTTDLKIVEIVEDNFQKTEQHKQTWDEFNKIIDHLKRIILFFFSCNKPSKEFMSAVDFAS